MLCVLLPDTPNKYPQYMFSWRYKKKILCGYPLLSVAMPWVPNFTATIISEPNNSKNGNTGKKSQRSLSIQIMKELMSQLFAVQQKVKRLHKKTVAFVNWVQYLCSEGSIYLNLNHSLSKFSRRQIGNFFFLILPRRFDISCDNLHKMSKPVFWEKIKIYFNMSSAENFT